jgi:HTH-type transcriptional regulator / antitoxin HigA
MTRIIDKTTYGALLSQYQPKVIETEEENEAAIALAEALEHRERTPEEDLFLELLVILIEKFEDEYYRIGAATPQSILLHLMEARDIKQEDLVGIIGSREVVSEVMNGNRNINKSQAEALGEFFNISSELFV